MELNKIKRYQLNNAKAESRGDAPFFFVNTEEGMEVLKPGEGIFLSSPNGVRWKLSISNTGQIEVTIATLEP